MACTHLLHIATHSFHKRLFGVKTMHSNDGYFMLYDIAIIKIKPHVRKYVLIICISKNQKYIFHDYNDTIISNNTENVNKY